MYDIYEKIDIYEYNLNQKHKILIVFDDMISNMVSNNKLNLLVTELFIRGENAKHLSCFYYIILFCCSKQY